VPIADASIVSSLTFFPELAGNAAKSSKPEIIKPMKAHLEDLAPTFLCNDIEFSP
jgi:hypothetical protein